MTEHPMAPPPELIEDWIEVAKPEPWKRPPDPNVLCTLAAQWGANQELEACIDWISVYQGLEHSELLIELLRAARRPKPPSLKEALDDLHIAFDRGCLSEGQADTIRRALEQLPDHE